MLIKMKIRIILVLNSKLSYDNVCFVKAMETDINGGNKSDTGSMTEQYMKGDRSEIAIRVPRCTKSHR